MEIIFAIDDTDMPGTKGTGWLVQEIAEDLSKLGWGEFSAISRHQLFVHEDVPYTSHNSSMCCQLKINPNNSISDLTAILIEKIIERSIPGSDPGLCLTPLDSLDKNKINALIEFGKRAKREVLNKDLAYELAKKLDIHLSEHGGTGDGIIGAISGVGLRLAGDDGRYRGWYHLGTSGSTVSIKEINEKIPLLEGIFTEDGKELVDDDLVIEIGSDKIKTIRRAGKQILLLKNSGDKAQYRTITHIEAKDF